MIQTRKIRTGDFNLYAIDSHDIKKQIVCYLKDKIGTTLVERPITNAHFNEIQTIKKAYDATIDYVGKKYYVVINKIKNNNFITFIDKKAVNDTDDISRIEILFCPVRLPTNAYDGTIAVGTLIKNIHCNEYIFSIANCFQICGESVISKPIKRRLQQVDSMTIKNIKRDTFINTLKFKTIEIFSFQAIEKKLQHASNNHAINGVMFVSDKSNTCYTYKTQRETTSELTANFEMHATQTVDVYELYLCVDDGHKMLSIACTQTMKDSLYYKTLFDQKKVKPVRVKCKYNKKFNKWEPMELTTAMDNYHCVKFKLEQVK